MNIGVGLDPTLGLNLEEQNQLSEKAVSLGYQSIWTPEGTGQDSYQLCLNRWRATQKIIPCGLDTGIAVSPIIWRSPMAFAMTGGTISQITDGKFIMGIGAGAAYRSNVLKSVGMKKVSVLALMRDYITIIKGLLNGETVTYNGRAQTLHNGKLAIYPPPITPVYLGALGPKMLSLAGELADGAALNWCAPEQIEWSREQIETGSYCANRDPADIKVSEYIRICVDEDVDKARIALAKATIPYALGVSIPTEKERRFGYRAHFERMGFTKDLAKLDRMREKHATKEEIADAFPGDLLLKVGYFGKAGGALKAFQNLSKGLDNAIVRVVSSQPGSINSTLNVMNACAPITAS